MVTPYQIKVRGALEQKIHYTRADDETKETNGEGDKYLRVIYWIRTGREV